MKEEAQVGEREKESGRKRVEGREWREGSSIELRTPLKSERERESGKESVVEQGRQRERVKESGREKERKRGRFGPLS